MTRDDQITDALAVMRLTRLATKDVLTKPAREAVIAESYDQLRPLGMDSLPWSIIVAHDQNPPKIATLVTCPWCFGMWVAVAVVAARRYAPRVWSPVARALALSQLAGYGANLDID